MSLSLAPSNWASFGSSGGSQLASTSSTLLIGSSANAANRAAPGDKGSAPLVPPYYSSIGGGAAPSFGPSFDLNMLEKGALLKSCMRHIKRTTRRRQAGHRGSRELSQNPAGLSFLVPGGQSKSAFFHYEGTNRLGKLYCRSGYHLQIHNDGKVNGTRQENSRFGVLEFLSVAFGLVSIKGKESSKYLCMNKRGRLYGSSNHSEECIFMEKMLENYYNTYTSCKYGRGRRSKRKWYVALNKKGRPKKGNRARQKHKFTQFLVLHLDGEEYKWTRRKLVLSNRDTLFGINSFTQDWRRRQSPWERVRTIQRSSTPSVVNIPLSETGTARKQTRARVRLKRMASKFAWPWPSDTGQIG